MTNASLDTRRTGDVSPVRPSALCATTTQGAGADEAGTSDKQAECPGQGAGGVRTRVGKLPARVRRSSRGRRNGRVDDGGGNQLHVDGERGAE